MSTTGPAARSCRMVLTSPTHGLLRWLTCHRTRQWRPRGAAPAAGPPTRTARPCSRPRPTEAAHAHWFQVTRRAHSKNHTSRQPSRTIPSPGCRKRTFISGAPVCYRAGGATLSVLGGFCTLYVFLFQRRRRGASRGFHGDPRCAPLELM